MVAIFRVPPIVVVKLSHQFTNHLDYPYDMHKHLLRALQFLWVHSSDNVNSSIFGCGENTFRKCVLYFSFKLAKLNFVSILRYGFKLINEKSIIILWTHTQQRLSTYSSREIDDCIAIVILLMGRGCMSVWMVQTLSFTCLSHLIRSVTTTNTTDWGYSTRLLYVSTSKVLCGRQDRLFAGRIRPWQFSQDSLSHPFVVGIVLKLTVARLALNVLQKPLWHKKTGSMEVHRVARLDMRITMK